MPQNIIFRDSFLVSGIMCHGGCGQTIQALLNNFLDECKENQRLPHDAQLFMDAEPESLGIQRLFISIESDEQEFKLQEEEYKCFAATLKESIPFEILDAENQSKKKKLAKINWINILVNLLAIAAILTLTILFPPSLPLALGLTALTFITTAFTSRHYLLGFFRNLRAKTIATMATPITFAWVLSLAHSLYHSIGMPLVRSFSMSFMSFIMPLTLITIINGMDEIKRRVLEKAQKMHLQGLKTLFPQMAKRYRAYSLPLGIQHQLTSFINDKTKPTQQELDALLEEAKFANHSKKKLKKGMIIKVRRGECFPVDGYILQDNAVIDAAILTGEPRQPKQFLDPIPAGAINLGAEASLYASEDSYNSAVNKLLFSSNRAAEDKKISKSSPKFLILYSVLIGLALAAAILIPLALGIFTIPLLLQNLTGILFAICPCTLAIAHQLPKLLSLYQRNKKGINLRNDFLSGEAVDIDTIVFDKTGTLTTGNSLVDSSEGLSAALWQRIYLLEKEHGGEHPLAKAIINHCEKRNKRNQKILLRDIGQVDIDSSNRGLAARVQGKTIRIGNAAYLQQCGIKLPDVFSDIIEAKLAKGYTPIYVAEEAVYRGVIFIKHQLRKGVLTSLKRLKSQGKTLILLTGDTALSANSFNQQHGAIFDSKHIHAGQTPEDKEHFLRQLMDSKDEKERKGLWFVGDGLNDAPCARIVSEKGGISAAMNTKDKAAFFTDLSLNGSLDYLFHHKKLNHFFKKNTLQNQGIMLYSILAFLAFIITFSIVGIAVSPLIPVAVMVATTLFTLFNSYRAKLAVDVALDKKSSWFKKCLTSDLSLGLLIGGATLLITAILIATVATGGLALPALAFSSGFIMALSSACTIGAAALFGAFALLSLGYLITKEGDIEVTEERDVVKETKKVSLLAEPTTGKRASLNFGYGAVVERQVGEPQVKGEVPQNLALV